MDNLFKRRREELGITQRQIADAIRPPMTSAAVGQWERGQAMPELGLLGQLAEIYKLPESKLLREIIDFKKARQETAAAKA
jgi:transcriptional regulator with XRE-family HTH domain